MVFVWQCYYCKNKLSSQCERTNSNTIENAMYGGRTAGMFGYSSVSHCFPTNPTIN